MNQDRGLLAFCCAMLAITTAFYHVPVVDGFSDLAAVFTSEREQPDPLLASLVSISDDGAAIGLDGERPFSVQELRRTGPRDGIVHQLASQHGISFFLLKTYLAWSHSRRLDMHGLYWGLWPEEPVPSDQENQLAAELGQRIRQLKSVPAALAASVCPSAWIERVLGSDRPDFIELMQRLKSMLPVYEREKTVRFVCHLNTITRLLQARWPVASHKTIHQDGRPLELDSQPAEPVRAHLWGRISDLASSPDVGWCLQLSHGCRLTSHLCGLSSTGLKPGMRVQAGDLLGKATQNGTVRLQMFLGKKMLDARIMLPFGQEPSPGSTPISLD
jgi:hypothetical protein